MLPLLSLILAATVVMGSPGPSTIGIIAVGAAFGLRRSLAYISGLVLGTLAVLLAVATGLVSLRLSVPQAVPVLLTVSALYILYLAYRIAAASCWPSPTPRPMSPPPPSSPEACSIP